VVGAGNVDGHSGSQMRRVVGHPRTFTFGADDEPGGRLDLDLDVPIESDGQRVEAGSEIG
jgi:hypothetical protein